MGGIPACIAGGIPACVAAGLGEGGLVSQHALQIPRLTPRGEVEGSGQWGSPGPHPRGKLRDLAWGSPGQHLGGLQAHPWGALQAHTQGGLQEHIQGASGPHLGGLQPHTQGVCVSQHALMQTPLMATAAGGTCPTGMHSCSRDRHYIT